MKTYKFDPQKIATELFESVGLGKGNSKNEAIRFASTVDEKLVANSLDEYAILGKAIEFLQEDLTPKYPILKK